MRGKYYLAGSIAILAVSLAIRIISYDVITSDFTYFLSKWFDLLKSNPGLTAFQTPFSDYAPLYVYALKILTFIPVYSLYSIKTLSFLFDIVMAYFIYLAVKNNSGKGYTRAQLVFFFVLAISIPTVVLNSSLWGQSDSIYAAFVIGSLYYILKNKPQLSAILFGIAFAIKLQSIFFFPILLGYLLRQKNAVYLWYIPAIYVVAIIPAWLSGGSLRNLLLVYASQAQEYPHLSVSAQSIFAFFTFPLSSTMQNILSIAGIIAALALVWLIAKRISDTETIGAREMVLIALFCVLLIPYVLPRMHERYFYLADIVSLLYAYFDPKRWYLPVLVVLSSFLAYMHYLSAAVPWFSIFRVDLRIASALLLMAIMIIVYLTPLLNSKGKKYSIKNWLDVIWSRSG